MKKYIRILAVSLLTAMSTFESYAQSTQLSENDQNRILTSFSNWLDVQSEPETALQKLETKVTIAKLTYTTKSYIIEVLEYIQYLIEIAEKQAESQEPTETDTQGDQQEENNQEDATKPEQQANTEIADFSVSDYVSGPKIILAGTNTGPIIEREVVANLEDIIVDEIILNTSTSLEQAVNLVTLVDEQGKIVGSARPTSATITFKTDYVFPLGPTKLYVLLETMQSGNTQPGITIPSFTVELQVQGKGKWSNQNISNSLLNTNDRITIAPIKITDLNIVKSTNDYTSDSFLKDGDRTEIALIIVETAESSNYQENSPQRIETVLQELSVKLYNGTEDSNLFSTVELERLDRDTGRISGTSNGSTATFDLTTLSQQGNYIENGDTAIFALSVTANLSAGKDNEHIEIALPELDGQMIEYTSNSPGTPTYSHLYLRSSTDSLTIKE